jgi:carbonic anhydrase/acetyltransferase-like protein (isoleucine patch superfamily)
MFPSTYPTHPTHPTHPTYPPLPVIYEFQGIIPVVDSSAFVHPQAAVTGNVIIGRDCYIGPGAALRGDWGGIVLEDGCNVQENCTIHMFPGVTVVLEAGAHVGHGAIIHGARLGRNTLIGMNAVVMDNAVVGAGSVRRRAHLRAGRDSRFPTEGRGRKSRAHRQGCERRNARVEDGRDRALPEASRRDARDMEDRGAVARGSNRTTGTEVRLRDVGNQVGEVG